MYRNLFKPLFDFLLALIGLLVLSPIFLLLMIVLAITNQGKPFFFQKRPGKHEKIFTIIKFKTMDDRKDARGILLSNAERLTKIGSFVRKTSLDEIPQLINVLKGDMSLIGPRPLLIEYLPYYSSKQRRRHDVLPGITGLAQVNDRNIFSWVQKFKYDVWYVDHCSFSLDFKILLKTIPRVFTHKGINQHGQVTSELFNGNN